MICNNCQHQGLEILDERDGHDRPLVTSDAQLLDAVRAVRTLCPACACVEVHYDPADRLQKFFAAQYDVSDAIQDNLVVQDDRVVGKHTVVKGQGAELIATLPDRGRALEIACGSGDWLAWLLEQRPGFACWGIDPAAHAGAALPEQATFIRDRFELDALPDEPFDLIVAHGFLNRAPTLPELRKIRILSRPGTLLSIEIVILEESVFAPHVWDHPFHFRREVFEHYLQSLGFEVEAWHDCVSAWNCRARCTGDGGDLAVPGDQVALTRRHWLEQLSWWETGAEALRQDPLPSGLRPAIFGAGLYSAVLHHEAARDLDFSVVIDDIKAGQTFADRPVITVAEAATAGDLHVRLLTRDRYLASVSDQLARAGISYTAAP